MEWTRKLDTINEILADLYPTRGEMRRLISIAGLSLARIDFDGKGIDIWHRIITEAISQGRLNVLIEKCIEEFPQNQELQKAYQNYRKDPAPSEPPDTDYLRLPIQPTL